MATSSLQKPTIPGQRSLERSAAQDGMTQASRNPSSGLSGGGQLWSPSPAAKQNNVIKALRNRQ